MWLVLLLPSWLPALGWVRLVQPDGVMYRLGLDSPLVTHAILGPFGVVLLLGLRSVPFGFLAITAALAGLGQEFEDAARVHGASRAQAMRLVAPILAPAIWSALAIGFAESISDFGVAATLAYSSHFSLATYQLYAAIGNFPPSFPMAAAMGWLLVASVAIPLALQARALRGRSYAILSGRTRQAVRRQLCRRAALAAAVGVVALLRSSRSASPPSARSAPRCSATSAARSTSRSRTTAPCSPAPTCSRPLERSLVYGAITASITVVGGFVAARLLAQRRTRATGALDFLLLAAVALPSVVFAAGYILAYNLPILSRLGIDLYQTTTLLIIAYAASSLPTNARVLVGAVSQLQASLHDAARAHGAGALVAWARGRAAGGLAAARHGLAAHLLRRLPRAADLAAALRAGLAARLGRDRGQPRQLPLRRRHGPGRPRRGHRAGRGRAWCSAPTGCWPRRLAPDRRSRPCLSGSRSSTSKTYPGGNVALETSP